MGAGATVGDGAAADLEVEEMETGGVVDTSPVEAGQNTVVGAVWTGRGEVRADMVVEVEETAAEVDAVASGTEYKSAESLRRICSSLFQEPRSPDLDRSYQRNISATCMGRTYLPWRPASSAWRSSRRSRRGRAFSP